MIPSDRGIMLIAEELLALSCGEIFPDVIAEIANKSTLPRQSGHGGEKCFRDTVRHIRASGVTPGGGDVAVSHNDSVQAGSGLSRAENLEVRLPLSKCRAKLFGHVLRRRI